MKKTTRFHRGDSPFKMISPLKDGDNSKVGSSSSETKSIPARSGDIKGTYKTTTTRTKTDAVAVNSGATKAKKRPMMGNAKWKEYLKHETPEQKKNRLAREAKESAEDKAAASNPSTTSQGGETVENKSEFTPEKTEKVEGTTSDTFTAEERRIQNRGEKINMRQERQLGKQGLRRDKNYMKQSADWQKMTPEERKAAKNELKHGKASDDKTPSILEAKFGPGFKDRVNKEREMKHGQGEMNKALINQEVKNPGDAAATRMEQYTQGKGFVHSTETENNAGVEKKQAGGKNVKVTKEEKATLPDVASGSSSSSSSNSAVSTTGATTANPAATQNNKEQSDALEKHRERKPLTPVDGTLEGAPSSVAKMASKPRGFSMKGFGSKSGFNFNIKK